MNDKWHQASNIIAEAQHIVVVQAENPDGDSVGSALALEEMLGDLGKKVSLFCAVDMPKYLHYFAGWDRVEKELPADADAVIVVDNSVQTLMEKTLTTANSAVLARSKLIAFDHHGEFHADDLLDKRFPHALIINEPFVAAGELLTEFALACDWPVNATAATHLTGAILSDSLGLTVEAVTPSTLVRVSKLMEKGASIAAIEKSRREFMKKSPEILHYKGELLQRIEYFVDGRFALIHIPWPEIEKYSDRYNPSVLVIDEMRLVQGVDVAISLKTYPDGKITAKIRSTLPVGDKIAAHFDGGGHPMAAGFKRYSHDFIGLKKELIATVANVLEACDNTESC